MHSQNTSIKTFHGFTLLEMLIVIAIIGILATLAIPTYQTHLNKTKFTEIVLATAPYKTAIASCALQEGMITNCVNGANGAGQYGIPPAIANPPNIRSYIKSMIVNAVDANHVQIVASSQHIGSDNMSYTYIITGEYGSNGQITWRKDENSSCVTHGIC
jgi:type IV pilus assembly protein PilA